MSDMINHPPHYTSHPSGVECIQITEHMGFNIGNAIKYLWRADEKGSSMEDLKKARWYIDREIVRRELGANIDSGVVQYCNGCGIPHGSGDRCGRLTSDPNGLSYGLAHGRLEEQASKEGVK